jgi:hypothetical protein
MPAILAQARPAAAGGDAVAQDQAGSVRRAERDASPAGGLHRRLRRLQVARGEQCADHDLHLQLGEAGAQAAAPSTAEGQPGVRARRGAQEALGPEGVGLRIDVGVVVDEIRAGEQRHAGRVFDTADRDRLDDEPGLGVGDHGMQAHDLLDRGDRVVLLARVGLYTNSFADALVAREAGEDPRELRGGRLVAGDERRDELVAQLLGAHRRAVLVACTQQQAEHVGTFGPFSAALVDEREKQFVAALAQPFDARDRADAAEHAGRRREQRERALAVREDPRQQVAELIERSAPLEPEHGTQDDLQRQALQARVQLDHGAPRPGGDLALGQLAHQAGEGLHALAVERGQQQLALLQVWFLVEQDHRVGPDHRFQDASALARVQHVGWRHEDLLDLVGIGDHHDRGKAEQANREPLAVAGAGAFEEARRPTPVADRLQERGHARAGGKAGGHRTLISCGWASPTICLYR